MNTITSRVLAVTLFIFASTVVTSSAQNVLVGGPCEGCEAIFEYLSETTGPLPSSATLPGFAGASQELELRGSILMPDGQTPAENVILYIYHTNTDGEYATRGDEQGWARRHGYIRGWIKTGPDGRYTFRTHMPGSYSSLPAHVHPLILEPNGMYYYLESWFFKGDPNYNENHEEGGRGGNGLVALAEENGVLIAERDIVLGLNVPGYDHDR